MDELAVINQHLEAAERRVAEGARRVLIQREIVVKLAQMGSDTRIARQLLATFKLTVAFYIVERDRLIREKRILTGDP